MVITTKQDYLSKIDFDYLLRYASETKLYRNYRQYFTKRDFVNALLRTLTKNQCIDLYNAFMSEIPPGHMALSFLNENPTYPIIREKLVEFINGEKRKDEVIFFEFPVLNTRTDVTRVNGYSYNYEIKTGRDKITRLKNQMETFTTLFERNLVVCPENYYDAILDYVPSTAGVIIYELQESNIYFKERIPPKNSVSLNSENQLNVLTIKRLKHIYEKRIGKAVPSTRSRLIESMSSRFSPHEVNEEFKLYLKEKYTLKNNRLLTDYT